ncbi:Very-long-chain 3-oxoacyl-CoA reductase [Dirofilaria immitis]
MMKLWIYANIEKYAKLDDAKVLIAFRGEVDIIQKFLLTMNLIVFGILLVTIFQKQFSAQEAVSNDVSYEFMNPNSNSLRSNLNSYADQANDRLFELENAERSKNKRTKRLIPSPAKMAGKLMCSLVG